MLCRLPLHLVHVARFIDNEVKGAEGEEFPRLELETCVEDDSHRRVLKISRTSPCLARQLSVFSIGSPSRDDRREGFETGLGLVRRFTKVYRTRETSI